MEKLSQYSFEIGTIRPPSEGGSSSLLIRLTRNCPWNRCGFCYGKPYNHEKFSLRTVEEIKKDIDDAKAISDGIKQVSWQLGDSGQITNAVVAALLQKDPDLRGSYSFVTVLNWLASGGRTTFLQDADSLIMRTPDLVEVIQYLKATFPSLERVTSYARGKTLYRKTREELMSLREAGLTRLHIGLESGDDEVLKYTDKGVTAEEHIAAGKKVKELGFEVSTYVMPGLGGRKWSDQHARNTARVLNEINPDYIRLRPFIPGINTPMFRDYERGDFQLTSPHERLREIRLMVESLTVTSRLCFDHMMNGWRKESGGHLFKQDYEGYKLPEEKARVLELIEEGLRVKESKHVDAKDLVGMQM
ncbi:MAG: radical SAM protein [Dehalococcoidia bacterium]|nr:radical SAM protein [Dehalococcoidia bacterium]